MSNKNNTGDYNSGDYNSGDYNSRDYNTGSYNTGSYNSGYYNTGHYNSGCWNSGDRNSGDRNSGDYNSGRCNSGDYNSGDYNSGFFCTETPKPLFFDLPTDLTWEEACSLVPNIELDLTDKSYKEAFVEAWFKLNEKVKQQFLDLPNFNADKFFQITGVDVRNISTAKVKHTIAIDGKEMPISDETYATLKALLENLK